VIMAEVGRPGQPIDPITGGDVAADGSLLSVAQIQERFRKERARRALATEPGPVDVAPADTQPAPAPPPMAPAAAADELRLAPEWIRVIAGHSGAGSSTVALALADAAAATGRRAQLVEAAAPSRSGLVAAASAELGLDPTGAWRRGTRGQPTELGQVIITRRAVDTLPSCWPVDSANPDRSGAGSTSSPSEPMVAVDLGLPPTDALARLGGRDSRIVVVCRATIPGVRLTEQLLGRLDSVHLFVAMLGRRRWPGEVTSSSGPRLRALRETGRIVAVPVDLHLAVTGPTYTPLPKTVLAAGHALLGLIDAARLGDATTTAHGAPRRKETGR
jgi:hypothetical protein